MDTVQYRRGLEIMAFLFVALFVMVVGLFIHVTMRRVEASECERWRGYAERYSSWYATNAERMQCDAVGVPLPENSERVTTPCWRGEPPAMCQGRLGDAWEVLYSPVTGEAWGERVR